MTELLQLQPKRGDIRRLFHRSDGQRLVLKNPMLRRILKISGEYLPYLAWLVPLLDRMLPSKRNNNALAPGLLTLGADLRNDIRGDLKQHIIALQATQVDVSPAIEEQQRRLEKLEEHAAELNHSLTNLSEDQLDLADQVRSMAGWVRNATLAGLFLLTLMFILKLIQAIHGMGH